ncbi:AgmX/PglI C-terminal domain-containing protein [Nannocystis sp. SCPEA4]|uniref:AgmX/PglI C-terminal domain-containing protein n=1 Tax=Nannocystis sp. SCPEA4 TaxID=2996787 RepID=UPI00227095A7|nr:AgmX/PglI C-terminal domain-containing protein [Nannocystis sp. SCPEA4]MCY1055926.1 AgmX/PglI C-terminal domain-containing protein [Nannocystis sp. SCPEA4]
MLLGTCPNVLVRRAAGATAALASWMLGCTANPGKVEATATTMALPSKGVKLTDDGAMRRAPVSLTASDGTGLKLVSFKARGVVEEPLAFTELHLVFENPNDRQIEGRFEIDMPPGAAISRFAMKIHDRWQEGEVVERQAARVAYEDFLHKRQDPALLENKAGNSFSARVFPIGPRERKELIVSYSQELPSSAEPYRLMLRGLPELDELDASVILREPGDSAAPTSLGGAAVQTRVIEVKKQKYLPERDLEVRSDRASTRMGLRHDNLVVARVAPAGDMPAVPIGALTVLFDTSASRALGFDRQIRRLADVLKNMREQSGEDFPLRVVCFDQTTETVYSGPASGFGQAQLERIASRRALGASDLAGALTAVAADASGSQRLLVFSDGITTAGSAEHAALRDAAKTLAAAGFERADAIVDGGIQDTTTLKALTTADLPRDGVVMDARLPLETIAHKLGSATLPAMKVSVPGAAWVWPDTIEGAQPGDEMLVYADLPADAAMRVVIEGQDRIEAEVPTTAVERPLLERAWVRAQVERLQAQRSSLPEKDEAARAGLQKTIVELSTKYRVLSDFTALLVLESEWDYQRFNIDRNALADILTVGATGVELYNRKSPPAIKPEPGTLVNREPREEFRGPAEPQRDAIPMMARNFDPEMASRQAGILGTMSQESGHFLASPYGGAFAVGNDDADVWGGLTGTEVGESYGVGGLGLVGTGRGGGGTGEGTIGLGNTGLIGRGGGGGTGSGYGRGAGAGFGGRGTRVPMVRQAKAEVQGALDKDIIRRIVRAHINEIRYCYNQALARDPNAKGRVAIQFVIGGTGKVPSAVVSESTMRDARAGTCMAQAVRRWTFPKPQGGGSVTVTYPFILESGGGVPADYTPPPPPTPEELARQRAEEEAWQARMREQDAQRQAEQAEADRTAESPYTGKFFDVAQKLKQNDARGAVALALEWHEQDPGDVLALIALGEAAETAGDPITAARAYGSIIDLFPSRADLRRYVGARLERLGSAGAVLAVDTFAKAVESRPDHPSSHRLYAYALLKAGKHKEAFEAIKAGATRTYPWGRFAGVDKILREDVGLIAAAWIKAEPSAAFTVRATLDGLNIPLASKPSTRFVINWETDANDVDFHVHDGRKDHAFYSQKTLPSGGQLYADVTTGYGPECFTIDGEPQAFPYKLEAHYFSRGPMGYGMGKLQIVQHDGKGELRFEERPFVIMKDRAYVDLGQFTKPL